MLKRWAKPSGFTIVELLIVIVIIGVLTAISVVSYSGVQTRSKLSKIETDITTVHKMLESYKARTGSYPVTNASLNPDWDTETARTDANCPFGTRSTDWVPDLSSSLPQSSPTTWGVSGNPGCYMYVSDGKLYAISAWNMLSDPQNTNLYRRVGFRETGAGQISKEFYICNHPNIGGAVGSYDANNDYYKHSFTFSNVTTCVETPPAGA